MPPPGFTHRKLNQAELLALFESKFKIDRRSGCWMWTGPLFLNGGYGAFTVAPTGFIQARAHRVAWKLYRGPITEDQHVLHSCDNPPCVNPDHLFLGDQTSNMNDKVRKQRQDRGETHGMVKLTEKKVRAIRASGEYHRVLAKRYKVSLMTISDIKRRRSWRHV